MTPMMAGMPEEIQESLGRQVPFPPRLGRPEEYADTAAFIFGLGLMALRLGWQALEWYSRVYVLTDRRIIRRMGVLRVAVFEAQLKNIQHTSVFTRLRERVCGLGTIGFATSGTDVFEALWVMIRSPFEVHKIVVEAMQRYGKV